MVKKPIIISFVLLCILLNAFFVAICEDSETNDSEQDEVEEEPDEEEQEEQEPDYEKLRYYKKVFEPRGNFIAGGSDVELYKEPKEAEDEKVEVSINVEKTVYPSWSGISRYDVEFHAGYNAYDITLTKNHNSWTIERSIELEGQHGQAELKLEYGNDGRIVALDEIPTRQCSAYSEEVGDELETDEENEEDENEKDEEENDDTDEDKEPVYENSHQFKRSPFELQTSVEVYEEPQENNNTDGFEIKAGIDWNEPLYYTGSDKYVSLTYNGYGITVCRHGPDAGMNQCSSVEINGRHGNAELEKGFDTGVYPDVYV